MRVLMVSDVFYPRINGVSTSIETFRGALPNHGVEVSLIAPRYGDEPEEDGVTRIPARVLPKDPEDRLMRYGVLRKAVLQAAATHDVIHVQTPFAAHYAGLRAARRLNKPLMTTYHTLFEAYLQHYVPVLPAAWLRGLARRFSRAQCNDMDLVVVPSLAMHDRLLEYRVSSPLRILPTGLPDSSFTPGDRERFRAAHGIAPERPVALFVGRVAHEKNIGFLFDAFRLVLRAQPEALFLVTGEGPALPELRQHAARLGLGDAARFLGYLDRQTALADAYAAADVFVFASRTETQGLVLLEAMAQGCPVVGLAEMGTRDILGPQRGCIIAPDDVSGFARATLDVLRNPERRRALSAEAREYAHTWRDDALAGRLADVYRRLAAGR